MDPPPTLAKLSAAGTGAEDASRSPDARLEAAKDDLDDLENFIALLQRVLGAREMTESKKALRDTWASIRGVDIHGIAQLERSIASIKGLAYALCQVRGSAERRLIVAEEITYTEIPGAQSVRTRLIPQFG